MFRGIIISLLLDVNWELPIHAAWEDIRDNQAAASCYRANAW
jgi:hypothetical protein